MYAMPTSCTKCAEDPTFGGKEPFWDTLILHVIQAQRMLTFLILDTEIVS
jgi:hypothetical protein